ncbi:DUF2793 domain-containing protein [Sphingobium sp. BS19]|uniref:DUF2793 domain-containing protein n=1 Tax=Sphingobium sp. BS19 TaxID=3018973 RepID=UPI0022EE517D|nr:DUF2793 domain-containing protein [Sphingobium sp. BS19]GLI97643.1 hypothetical protein Sbs19_14610 [Sphingobium sp. BS19]|tara:strand:- start:308 stop:814 length:507 start_codon:yes stop_codon:yes gene_type:complete
MADELTDRFALPLLQAGQAQKEVTHNEALVRLDMLSHGAAVSADVSVPPSAPVAGQCWIVAAGASGAWAGQGGAIAGWTAGGWRFVAPVVGMAVWVVDRGHAMRWSGSAWIDAEVRADGLYQGGIRVVGAQGGAIMSPSGGGLVDAESRAAIDAILVMLRLHGMIAES